MFDRFIGLKMLTIRRSYMSCKLPKLPASILKNTSIGIFLQTTNKSCPRRNNVLGEIFCRFAVRLKLYTDAVSSQPEVDTNQLQHKFIEVISKLELREAAHHHESSHLKLTSTGQLLSTSVYKSLDKWKHSAYDEIQGAYGHSHSTSDDFISGTVREINYSLIGWYLQTYGMQNAFTFIQWLGVPLFSDPEHQSWPQPKSPLLKEYNHETQRKLDHLLDGYNAFEQKIKYRFQNKAHLLQSVTHESFTSNDLTSNYRGLDFVGDAILNYAIVRHLFRQPIQLDADELSNMSTLLYCNSSLATVSVRNDLHKYLRYTTPEIRDNINSFVAFLQRNRFKPVDDIYFLDKKNFVFEVPPIIPNCFEALIAAIYFDSAMNVNVVSNTILHLMRPDIHTICRMKPKNAYAELNSLDSEAVFCSPTTVGSGQVKVTVTLPKFHSKRFSAVSRDPLLAKWGAAKSAVIQLKNRQNVFIPTKHKDVLKQYENNAIEKMIIR